MSEAERQPGDSIEQTSRGGVGALVALEILVVFVAYLVYAALAPHP